MEILSVIELNSSSVYQTSGVNSLVAAHSNRRPPLYRESALFAHIYPPQLLQDEVMEA
jgi:hypothetical protein